MSLKFRRLALALGFSLVSWPLFAHASEVIVVEPVNKTMLTPINQNHYVVNAVQRAETICGNPGGNPQIKVPCYEFGMAYVTYPPAPADQVIHLPQCNAVGPLDPSCENATNDLCADPKLAPVCGRLIVEIVPVVSQEPLNTGTPPSGEWDGTSKTPPGQVWLNRNNGGGANRAAISPPVALIRIPKSKLAGTPVGLIRGWHTDVPVTFSDWGFFNTANRLLLFNEIYGDAANLLAFPVIFPQ